MTSSASQPGVSLDWDTLTLARGSHELGDTDDCGNPALCFMEAVNAIRGLGVTDSCPADVSETLHGFIVGLNDSLGTVQRQRLKLYRDRIVGTSGQPDADRRAAYMSVDWLIRTYTVAFLRLAGLTAHADALAGAGEVVDLVTLGRVTDHISAADSAARSTAYLAATSPARSAADLAMDLATNLAADSAAKQMLAPTVTMLQASTFDLLDRMLAEYTVVAA